MKQKLKITICFFAVLAFGSCKKNEAELFPQAIAANKPPVAIAGSDKFLVLPMNSTQLDGSGYDLDGTISNFHWSKILGPSSIIITSPGSAVTRIENLVHGKYEFVLSLTDNRGVSSSDLVIVYVLDSITEPCYTCWDY